MAVNVPLGLSIDFSKWSKDLGSAGALARRVFAPATLKPFETQVNKLGFALNQNIVRPLMAGYRYATSMKGVLTLLTSAVLASKTFAFFKDALSLYEALEDSHNVLQASIDASGEVFKDNSFKTYLDDIGKRFAIGARQINAAASQFIDAGFAQDVVKDLVYYASVASSKTGGSLEESSERILKALDGSKEALRKLGLNYQLTGNKITDGIGILEKMESSFSAIDSSLVDTTDKISNVYERTKIFFGASIAPTVNRWLERLVAAFERSGSDSEKNITKGQILVDSFGGFVVELGDFVLTFGDLLYRFVKGVGQAIYFSIRDIGDFIGSSIPAYATLFAASLLDAFKSVGGGGILGALGVDPNQMRQIGNAILADVANARAQRDERYQSNKALLRGDVLAIGGKLTDAISYQTEGSIPAPSPHVGALRRALPAGRDQGRTSRRRASAQDVETGIRMMNPPKENETIQVNTTVKLTAQGSDRFGKMSN